MLTILRRIVQAVAAAPNLDEALTQIVRNVRDALRAEVCSVYLYRQEEDQYVLMATEGLNLRSVGRVRMSHGQGLVSLVGEYGELVNLDNGADHPRYIPVGETGEQGFKAFLGVPLIHRRQMLGVLVVRRTAMQRFNDNEVALAFTIAAQLSSIIAHAELAGDIDRLGASKGHENLLLTGMPGAPGVAAGTCVVINPRLTLELVPDRPVQNYDREIAFFDHAVQEVRRQIKRLKNQSSAVLSREEQALFDAYVLMIEDEQLVREVHERIRAGQWAAGALRDVIIRHAAVFEGMDDAYLSERASDVRDLGRRVLLELQKGSDQAHEWPDKMILVGDEIAASTLAEYPVQCIAGVVSARGSSFSHVAILAQAMGIPAVMGVSDLPVKRLDGKQVVVDGYQGRAYVSPSRVVLREYARLNREEQKLTSELQKTRHQPACTIDGQRITLYANTGLLADLTPSYECGAEGIGLYRTEFPFMIRERFPVEEEQRRIYRQPLEMFAPRPVTLRTLDIGGDKRLSYFPVAEDNPFLGWRGIRIMLDHPEIFLIQLRAMLRASAGLNNLQVLLPMISTLDELDAALALVERTYTEVAEAHSTVDRPKIGVMIEVPASLFQIDEIARRVDFLSIGSNDLTQYLLAVDRNNERVAKLYDALHPAILRAVHAAVKTAREQCIPVGVCGELAGIPAGALLLLGMGVNNLSMNAASLPRIKWAIRGFSYTQAKDLVAEALVMNSPQDVRRYVNRQLEKAGLGSLVRAGK